MVENNKNNKMKEKEGKGGGVSKRRSKVEVDQWAFLEEIEAPMWADLTLELNLTTEDKEDAWFHTCHPFHHLSARRLRSEFAHPDASNDLFNFNSRALCSPKLPSSVSKSRGKDYGSRDWISNGRISIDKGHPVNDFVGKVSRLDTAPGHQCIPKRGSDHQSEVSSSITSLTCSSSCALVASCNSDDAHTHGANNSQSVSTSEISTSTITSISHKQTSNFSEISKGEFGQPGGLLNALRANLRKSCATRPASRVEVCGNREVKGRKSSNGKSSVGSSSIGCDAEGKRSVTTSNMNRQKFEITDKNATLRMKCRESYTRKADRGFSIPTTEVKKGAVGVEQKDRKHNVRGAGKFAQPNKIGKASKAGETLLKKNVSRIKQIENRNSIVRDVGRMPLPVRGCVKAQGSVRNVRASNTRINGRDAATVSTSLGAAKPKVLILENAVNRPRVETPDVKGKAGNSRFNRSACAGKENLRGRAALSKTSDGKYNHPVVRTSDTKMPKLMSENKIRRVAPVGSSKMKMYRVDATKPPLDAPVYLR